MSDVTPFRLVGAGLVGLFLQQPSSALQGPFDRPALLAVSADTFAWSPTGRKFAYSNGASLVIVDMDGVARERCRMDSLGSHPPIREIQWSPDEERIAFVSARSSDRHETIWLSTFECSQPRDLMPAEATPSSPGVRAVAISAWKDPRMLFFLEHCGPGCQMLNVLNLDDGGRGWVCAAEGPFQWNRDRTRAAVDLHLGGLGLVNSELPLRAADRVPYCGTVIPGCSVLDGRTHGTQSRFEDWMWDNHHALITRGPCTFISVDHSGDLNVWDTDTTRLAVVASNASRASASPNGTRIAFLLFTPPRNVDLAIADTGAFRIVKRLALGTTPATPAVEDPLGLLEKDPSDFRTSWSPDGLQLLARDTKRNVLLLNVEGTEPPLNLGAGNATWAPAGRRLTLIDPTTHVLHIIEGMNQ
jgi:hypothetical protein